MKLTLEHRSVLGRRDKDDIIFMPRHCDLLRPWVFASVIELRVAGFLEGLGPITVRHHLLGPISCEEFRLTASGKELCQTHDIWRSE